MPAESARLLHRLGGRDRWFVAIAVGAAVAATPAAVLLGGRGSSQPRPRCVSTIEAGFMGGQTRTYCGSAAVAFCRARAARGAPLPAGCRRTGFEAEPAQP